MHGLSRQLVSHGSGLSRQVSLYTITVHSSLVLHPGSALLRNVINVNVQPSLFSLHDAMFAPPSSSVSLSEEEPSPSLCKLSSSTANSGNQWSFKPHWLEFSSSHLPPMSIYLLWQCWLRYIGRFPDTITWKFACLICWSGAILHGGSRLRSILRFRLMLPSGPPDLSFNIAARAASTDLNHGLPYKAHVCWRVQFQQCCRNIPYDS